MRQIIINLVSNAIRFTEDGEIVVRVSREEQREESCRIHVTVTDTGIGIPPDRQATLFEAFRQVDGSIARKYGGTGLGLTIASQLVQLMGGGIWVESEVGTGTCFHFTANFGLAKEIPGGTAETVSLCGLRMLVVDDNATNRQVLDGMLTSFGVMSDSVDGAEEAVRRMRAAADEGAPYRVALIDIQMPVTDGFTLVARIKQAPELVETAIIMMSSVGPRADHPQAVALAPAAYLMKPVSRAEVREALLAAASQHPLKTEAAATDRPAIGTPGRPVAVLLAEDNPVNQMVASQMLENRGFTAVIAGDGQEAIDRFSEQAFDVIFMDVQMPGTDGFEATQLIREKEEAAGLTRTPIIAMTAHAMTGYREQCLKVGMDDYIAKPVTSEGLLKVLLRHVPTALAS